MSLRSVKIIEAGEIKISKEKAEEYKSIVWKDLVCNIGEKIVDSCKEKVSSKEFTITFFSKGNINNLEDFVAKLNTSITSSLFYIQYNKNLKAIDCAKAKDEIPTELIYLIF